MGLNEQWYWSSEAQGSGIVENFWAVDLKILWIDVEYGFWV